MEHLCENIKEAKKQCEDIKFEYGQVTSYLKDIQLIDRAPKKEQEKLLAAAKQIVELTKERKRARSRNTNLRKPSAVPWIIMRTWWKMILKN